MIVTSYRTKKVVLGDKLEDILKESLPRLENGDVVAITSKIVSITQGNVVHKHSTDKETLVRQQAEKLIKDKEYETSQLFLTITNNILTPSAGIDESNGNGYFVLWPKNPMKEAENIWNFFREAYSVNQLGVLIIDSTFMPLRTGSISVGLGWCGFQPVKNYIGTPDIFGEPLKYTTTSLVDSLSVAAGLTMGEGNEQRPLAIAKDIPDIEFLDRSPTDEEKSAMYYPLEKDMFGPLILYAPWETGENNAE